MIQKHPKFILLGGFALIMMGLIFVQKTQIKPPQTKVAAPSATPPVSNIEVLQQARDLAASNRFRNAIDLVAAQIPPGDPIYEQANRLKAAWNQEIMGRALTQYSQANLIDAILFARAIQPESSLYPQAQAQADQWQDEYNILMAAHENYRTGRYEQVLQTLIPLSESPLIRSDKVAQLLSQSAAKSKAPVPESLVRSIVTVKPEEDTPEKVGTYRQTAGEFLNPKTRQ